MSVYLGKIIKESESNGTFPYCRNINVVYICHLQTQVCLLNCASAKLKSDTGYFSVGEIVTVILFSTLSSYPPSIAFLHSYQLTSLSSLYSVIMAALTPLINVIPSLKTP